MRGRGRGGLRALIALVTLSTTAAAQPTAPPIQPAPAEDDALRRELDELHAKQRELERRLENHRHESRRDLTAPRLPAPPPPVPDELVPRFRFGRGGFVFSTADGRTNVKLRAVFNLDGHAFFGDVKPLPDTFFVRRARPFIDGTLLDVIDFRIMPDFAQGQAQLLDGYVDLRPFPWLRLRGGRFMIPVGLEWMQKDTTTSFVERSLATDLVPWRDIGVMLFGDVADGTFAYWLALVNGGPDGGNGPDFDTQSNKDYVARVFVRPLRHVARASFTDLGFGAAGSYGTVEGTVASQQLPTYKTASMQPIFTYLLPSKAALAAGGPTAPADAAVVAAGNRWRFTPQLYWYAGPIGLLAEYVMSTQHVQRGDASADLQNRAWNLTLSFVLTLERATYDGVTPRRPVDFRHRGFGAFEVVMRYSELRIDPDAFPVFADATVSVHTARELAAGLNWYVTDYVKLMVSFHRTQFEGGAGATATGAAGDREPENALMGRLQLAL